MTIDFNKPKLRVVESNEVRKERLRETVHAQIDSFVRHLLPNAKKESRGYRVGDVDGSHGTSLSITTTGERIGRWYDHADSPQGDIFTLWAEVNGLSVDREFSQILDEIESWTGGKVTTRDRIRHEEAKAKPAPRETRSELTGEWTYTTAQGEPFMIIKRFDKLYADDGSPVMKEKSDGTLKQDKDYRPYHASGRMGLPLLPSGLRMIYNLQGIARANEVVVTEGEKAAEALILAGHAATTHHGGDQIMPEKSDWTPLAGKTVSLWPDNDKGGIEHMGRLAHHLKRIGCTVRVVEIPEGKPYGWDAADALDEGADLRSIFNAESVAGEEIIEENYSDIDYVYEPELIDEILPRIGVATLYGPSTGGKSFVCVDMAIMLGLGRQFLAKDTEQCGIAYMAFEGYHGLRKRFHAVKEHKGYADVPLRLTDAPWNLTDEAQYADFEQHLRGIQSDMESAGQRLGVVIVDTLTNATAGSETNAQADVTAVMKKLKRTATRLGLLIFNVGHTGKNENNGMVGSFAYKSEADAFFEIRVTRDEIERKITQRSLFIDKVKDGPDGFVISDFELDVVSLGIKPNGKPITSCLVNWKPHVAAMTQAEVNLQNHLTRVAFELRTGPKNTNELAEAFSLKRNTMSAILSKLERNGDISAFTHEKVKFYEIDLSVGDVSEEGSDR